MKAYVSFYNKIGMGYVRLGRKPLDWKNTIDQLIADGSKQAPESGAAFFAIELASDDGSQYIRVTDMIDTFGNI